MMILSRYEVGVGGISRCGRFLHSHEGSGGENGNDVRAGVR